jgi:hypothetical protein
MIFSHTLIFQVDGASNVRADLNSTILLADFCKPPCVEGLNSDEPISPSNVCISTSPSGLSVLLVPTSSSCQTVSVECFPPCFVGQVCSLGVCQGSGNQTPSALVTPDNTLTLALAVAIPTAVVIGVLVAIFIKIYFTIKTKQATEKMTIELKKKNAESLNKAAVMLND